MSKLLICTDLDRTLIPNGPHPESPNARSYFSNLVSRAEVVLAYVSGRDKKLVEEAITHYGLPVPDFVIGDVGTTIYHVGEKKEWLRQSDWENRIAYDWGGKDYTELQKELNSIPALQPQELHKQNRFKLSYYVQMDEDRDVLSSIIKQRLKAADFNVRLIWSVDEPAGIGLLDILPFSVSKLHAIEQLMKTQGFNHTNTLFCGDSGNDLEVLVSPIQAVLVANSQPDVQEKAKKLAHQTGNGEQLYIARGFLGMNGYYSAGMLEGIAYYFPETLKWMK